MNWFFLILGLLFVWTAEATRPIGMYHPKNIAAQLQAHKKDHCNLNHDDSMSIHSFTVSIDCQYRCKKETADQSVTLSRYFDPENLNLDRGDGYSAKKYPMMTSFTGMFFNWTSQECLEEGIRKCGSIEAVESADFKTLSSGDWSISEKPSCKQKDRVLFSPYDKRYKLNTTKNANEVPPASTVLIPTGERIVSKKGEQKIKCDFPIKGSVCFGDCILYDDNKPSKETPLTLMTEDSPITNQEDEICGDSLVSSFKGKSLSPAVADSICQSFYMNSLVKAKPRGATCAAFRGQADCKKFIKKVSTR